jgi:hypothetical protein
LYGVGRRDQLSRKRCCSPDDGITKGELAAYYEQVATLTLPRITGRPATMERFPSGIGQPGFLQKSVSRGFPEWLQTIEVPKKGGTVQYPLVGEPARYSGSPIRTVQGMATWKPFEADVLIQQLHSDLFQQPAQAQHCLAQHTRALFRGVEVEQAQVRMVEVGHA